MITGFAESVKPIGPDIVRVVCDEFELRPGGGSVRPPDNGSSQRKTVATGAGASAKPAPAAETVVSSGASGNGNGLFAAIGKKRAFSLFLPARSRNL
jgi:hypothetical protein